MKTNYLVNLLEYCYNDENDFVLECLNDEDAEEYVSIKDVYKRIQFMESKGFEYLIFYSILQLMFQYNVPLSQFEK